MRRLLEPISPRGGILRADEARNTITLSAGSYILSDAPAGSVYIANTATTSRTTLTIVGAGAGSTIIQGSVALDNRVFQIVGVPIVGTNAKALV